MESNKQLQLVSFEQAKKLKELGFDWKVEYFYTKEGNLYNYYGDYDNKCSSAPFTSLSLKWLRDEKKIVIFVEPHVEFYGNKVEEFENEFYYCIYPIKIIDNMIYDTSEHFESYEAAESAGLDYALDYLLKQNQK